MKRVSWQLLAAKRKAQHTYLLSISQNEGKCWTEFYKYVKQHKGNREYVPADNDCNGRRITDSIDKAKSHNSYYASEFGREWNVPRK